MERRGSRREAKRASFDDATLIKVFVRQALVVPDFAFCSGDLINAFVWRVSASDDELLVTLDYDVENNEPARLDAQRVRAKCKWCPRQGSNLWPSAPEADALSN